LAGVSFDSLASLATGEHEERPVLALIFMDVDRRDDQAATLIVPALDVEIAVVIFADEACGEGGVGILLLARRLRFGARKHRCKRHGDGKRHNGNEIRMATLHGGKNPTPRRRDLRANAPHNLFTIMAKSGTGP
jgi:hypothetical protein